jgi:hypothetical protein
VSGITFWATEQVHLEIELQIRALGSNPPLLLTLVIKNNIDLYEYTYFSAFAIPITCRGGL